MTIEKQVNGLMREEVIELLESISIACYDNEPTDLLKEVLIVNIKEVILKL